MSILVESATRTMRDVQGLGLVKDVWSIAKCDRLIIAESSTSLPNVYAPFWAMLSRIKIRTPQTFMVVDELNHMTQRQNIVSKRGNQAPKRGQNDHSQLVSSHVPQCPISHWSDYELHRMEAMVHMVGNEMGSKMFVLWIYIKTPN